MSFDNRSDALIELLEELIQEGYEYVLVGGYDRLIGENSCDPFDESKNAVTAFENSD
jgi:hypothetical protein